VVDSSKDISFIEEKGDHPHEHDKEQGKSHEKEDEHEHEADPHFWLDFANARKMTDSILEGLVKKDPNNKEFYYRNAEQYKTKLNDLDRKFKETLSRCKKKTFVHAGHFAFGYLARRYGLNYVAAYGFSADAEPSPKKLIELTKTLKEHGLNHIYYEELITPRVAETISKETGATLLLLHGAHNLTREEFERGVTFISLMEGDLKNLEIGLQCQ
jgi:zinc transport system substrate-binding protein